MTPYDKIAQDIIPIIVEEWALQGHNMTSAFMDSVRYEVEETSDGAVIKFIDGTDRGYGAILNKGVTPDQIRYPFAKARIDGLTRFVMHPTRMGIIDEKQARSIAFAIATKHKREGMPLPSTDVLSKTGKRTQFAQDAMKKIQGIIMKHLIKQVKETLTEVYA